MLHRPWWSQLMTRAIFYRVQMGSTYRPTAKPTSQPTNQLTKPTTKQTKQPEFVVHAHQQISVAFIFTARPPGHCTSQELCGAAAVATDGTFSCCLDSWGLVIAQAAPRGAVLVLSRSASMDNLDLEFLVVSRQESELFSNLEIQMLCSKPVPSCTLTNIRRVSMFPFGYSGKELVNCPVPLGDVRFPGHRDSRFVWLRKSCSPNTWAKS